MSKLVFLWGLFQKEKSICVLEKKRLWVKRFGFYNLGGRIDMVDFSTSVEIVNDEPFLSFGSFVAQDDKASFYELLAVL